MKRLKSFTALSLSAVLAASLVMPVFAETTPSQKEEVIYIMADASGNVSDLEAVNIFPGGEITDYGDYSAVKSLNTTDPITQDGDKITFSTDADKVYYQGTMKDTTIPWDISIRYFLDGTEYSPEELAGQSGALEIRFSIRENENCKGDFYDNYALQASFTLDTDRCKNISADGATIANVGNNKQISYTILPGRGIDTTIKADVTDFEMSAVTVNGVRLSLNIDVDTSALTDKVNDLVSAIDSLDNGASELNSGTKTLSEATSTLNSKVGDLNTGVGRLTDGAGDLSNGLTAITEKNDQLTSGAYAAYQGLCSAAEKVLNTQLKSHGLKSVTLTPDTYAAVLDELTQKIGSSDQITALKEQLDNYGTFYQGVVDYTGAVSQAANGAGTLKTNMDTLYSNTGVLQTSVGSLNEAVQKLYGGTQKLSDGTSEFVSKTSNMDTQISDEINSMTSSLSGSDAATVSFVSEKNTNVSSVQFVFKTAAIEKAEAPVTEAAAEAPLTFWQKLLRLFGRS